MEKKKTIIYPKATNSLYGHFHSEHYALPLMVSEFIDNAISSWETFISKNIEGLIIRIYFRKKVDSYGSKNIEYREIEVRDNAAGMSFDELCNACEMYQTENKGQNDLNQHGIGMKSAMSWLGNDWVVYSKKESDNSINKIEFSYNDKHAGELLGIPASQIDYDESIIEGKSGTFIHILNIDKDRFDIFEDIENKKDKVKLFKAFLGWKYKYYLKQGLKLYFNYNSEESKFKDDESFYNFPIEPFEIPFWKKSDFINWIKKKNEKSNKFNEISLEQKLESKIREIQNKADPKSLKYVLCGLILMDKEVKTTYELTLGVENSKNNKLQITNLGIICSDVTKKTGFSYEKIQGLSIFHHNRGISIGPYFGNLVIGKMPSTYPFSSTDKPKVDGESSPVRLTGETIVKDIDTEINKSNIFFSENERTKLRYELEEIWRKEFSEILRVILNLENEFKPNKMMNENKGKKIGENSYLKLNQKQTDEKTKFTIVGDRYKWDPPSIEYDGESYIFHLIENNDLEEAFRYSEIDKNEIEIEYNYFHSIWYPLNEKEGNEEIRNIIQPWVIALCLAEVFIKRNEKGYEKKQIRLFEILNQITSNWRSSDEIEELLNKKKLMTEIKQVLTSEEIEELLNKKK